MPWSSESPVSALPTGPELVFSSLVANGSNRQGRLKDPIQKWKMVWQLWELQLTQHTGAAPTWSGWAIQARSGELSLTSPCTGHCTQPSFEQKPLHGTCSPWGVQLCHQGLHCTAFSSAVLHHHLPVGHLWAHPLKRTLARQSLILQIYPSPVSGSWWQQLVQKSKTGTPASSKRANAAKTAPDYCPDPTRWKGRTILSWIVLSPIYYISPLEFFSLISIFTVTSPGQIIRDTAFCSLPKLIRDQFTRIWQLGNPFISLT